MGITRRGFLTLAGVGWLAGCGGGAERLGPPAASDRLFLDTRAGLTVVETTRRRTAYTLPPALPTPDWSRLFASLPTADQTRLLTLDATTGAEVGHLALPGRLTAQAVASNGGLVALTEAPPPGQPAAPGQPAGRERTSLVIADPSGERPPRRIDLTGNYEPEAFAAANSHLFVIEHLPPQAPDRYRVRVCDLALGGVGPLATRLKTPLPTTAEEEMRGDRRQAVPAPDRSRLYTLYTHQPDHLHSRDLLRGGGRGREDVHAFVHVLNLIDGWAYCLDLPAPFGLGSAALHALALAPDGRRLFVADWASGHLAVADTEALEVKRVVNFGLTGPAGASAAARVAPDGHHLFLAGGDSLLTLDSFSLDLTRHRLLGAPIHSLALSHDGARLYAGLPERVIGLTTADTREFGRWSIPGLTALRHVG